MANTYSNTPDYTNLANIKEYWKNNIAPNYFSFDDVNNYNVGIFGYINEVMGNTVEDSFNAVAIARREFYPITAQYVNSLYAMATLQTIDVPLTKPAVCSCALIIPEEDFLRYAKVPLNDNNTNVGYKVYYIDDCLKIMCGDIPFMLDFPIKITAYSIKTESPAAGSINNDMSNPVSEWIYTARYEKENRKNSLSNNNIDIYIPTKIITDNNRNFIVLFISEIRQVEMVEISNTIIKDSILDSVTIDVDFDGDLANFEVFYKENDTEVQLEKVIMNGSKPDNAKYVQYEFITPNKIRLFFEYNPLFPVMFNSEIITKIYTSLGADGNFNMFVDDAQGTSNSEKYPYNNDTLFFGRINGSAIGGKDREITEEFRNMVIKAYNTNNTITTSNDLQMFFDDIGHNIDNVKVLFKKRRDDPLVRIYGAYTVMRDAYNNIIPTNTLRFKMKASELYSLIYGESDSGTLASHNPIVIKAGTMFRYQTPEEYNSNITNVLTIGNSDVYNTSNIPYLGYLDIYNSVIIKNDINNDSYETVNDYIGYDEESGEVIYEPKTVDKFRFITPFLININKNPNLVAYYLNSVNETYPIEYTYINDNVKIQFMCSALSLYRNAVVGSDFYTFRAVITPLSEELIDSKKIAVYINETAGIGNGTSTNANDYNIDIEIDDATEELIYGEIIGIKYGSYTYTRRSDENNVTSPNRFGVYYVAELHLKNKIDGSFTVRNLQIPASNSMSTFGTESSDELVPFDSITGYKLSYTIGDRFYAGDTIGVWRPTDLGNLVILLDLNDGSIDRLKDKNMFIPMTVQDIIESNNVKSYVLEGYLATDDSITADECFIYGDGVFTEDTNNCIVRASQKYTEDERAASFQLRMKNITAKMYLLIKDKITDTTTTSQTSLPSSSTIKHAYENIGNFNNFTLVNMYTTKSDKTLTFIESLKHIRSTVLIKPSLKQSSDPVDIVIDDDNVEQIDVTNNIIPMTPDEEGYDETIIIDEIPLVSAYWTKYPENYKYFLAKYNLILDNLNKAYYNLENNFTIDAKFYNTYGKARFYVWGNKEDELSKLDNVRISLRFGISINTVANTENFKDEFRNFVQAYVESTDGITVTGKNLYIMNLINALKVEFEEIDYIEYYGLNSYNHTAQRIEGPNLNTYIDDNFIPEYLNFKIIMNENGTEYPDISITIL